MNTTNTVAVTRARALASAFGHWWTQCPEFDSISLFDAAQVRAASEAAIARETKEMGAPPVGTTPHLQGGRLIHTTASGRLVWAIASDGTVEIEVTRPGGKTCLWAIVRPPRKGRVVVEAGPGEAPAFERHVDALAGALSVLGVPCPHAGHEIWADEAMVTPAIREARIAAQRLAEEPAR